MRVVVYLSSDNPVHDRALNAVADACPYEVERVSGFEWRPADVAVTFGIRKKDVPISWPRGEVIARQRAAGGKIVIVETGYVNRGDGPEHHYAVGFDGINGHADFRNENMPSDRWNKLGERLRPWRTEGKHILLCGQVPWDASVQDINMLEWLPRAALMVRMHTDRPIVYRPHPKAPVPPSVPGCETSERAFGKDLANAWATVTYNSNCAVESVIAGVPAFATGAGSMAAAVACPKLDLIERPWRPERRQWAWNLAYAQWRLDEMDQAWRHLFR